MIIRALAAFAAAATAVLVITSFSGELTAQQPPALFGDSAIGVPAIAGDGPTVVRARTTSARFNLLAAALAAGSAGDRTPAFTLNLFADVAFSVEYERFERDDFGHQSWVGRIIGDPLSTVTLTWKGDVLSGGVQVRDALYRVRSAEGRTVIEQLDPGSFGEERPPLIPPTGTTEAPLAGEPSRLAAGEVVDVAVFYTAAARAGAGGQPAIEALIAQGISDSNTAYARSNIQATMRLVGMGELAGFVESATDMSDDLRAFTSLPAVEAARNSVQADLMHLVVANTTGNACGIGWLGPRADFAHAVSARQCFAQFTFTHETGHNFGNHHAPEDGATGGYRPYSYGYKNCGAGTRFRTVMAYACASGANAPRILNMSNPAVAYSGMPSGTASQNNALSQSEAFPIVQGFRTGAPATVPGVPQNVQAAVVGNTISVSWQPPSGSTVLTYIVQAGTAPGASNIYRGGVGLVTTVSSPIANGTYYIRVAAQNLAGTGPASADVVAQVGLPPGPPQNVVAMASGGVITLSWAPPVSGGAVSNYIVQAGTASGAANLFNGGVGAVTAVSGAVAPGAYFLRVLAQGAGGTSIPSNETSVSVGPACTTPSAPVLTGSRSGNVVTIDWSTPPGGPVTGYTVIAGSAAGASNLFNGSVGLTNTVSAPVASGSYFIRVVANAVCGSGAVSNEVLVSVP
ncbi:MAG TPA: M12 family metallo-peptidase [Vicinamibacterales bacterium]|nr:M12 family metallo-peptidase [Vicinamibacterales bacterium]